MSLEVLLEKRQSTEFAIDFDVVSIQKFISKSSLSLRSDCTTACDCYCDCSNCITNCNCDCDVECFGDGYDL